MVAVCSTCDTVFQFELPDSKTKRRKVKQPQKITAHESDNHLSIAFRTNFRLERNEAFISSAVLSLLFTFLTFALMNKAFLKPASTLIPLGFGLLSVLLYYALALLAYNRTHINVNEDEIVVARKPLPNPFNPPVSISRSGIEIIRWEETPVSRKEGYDTPRYNVLAETVDGSRKLIVGDVIEDYAVFISQRLNEFLNQDADISRLLDHEGTTEDEQLPDEFTAQSESPRS